MGIFYITLSALLWSGVNIVDKVLIGKRISNPTPIFSRYCTLALVVGILGLAWTKTIITGIPLVLVIVAGAAAAVA